jgi:hypothetical protein
VKDAIVKFVLPRELSDIELLPIVVHFWPSNDNISTYTNNFFGNDFEIPLQGAEISPMCVELLNSDPQRAVYSL